MQIARIGLTLAIVLVILGLAAGCRTLALTGAEKYKVDMTQILMKVQDEIEKDGDISDRTLDKFNKFIENSREEFGKKGSFIRAEAVLDQIKEAKANPNEKFSILQSALIQSSEVLESLKTESSR